MDGFKNYFPFCERANCLFQGGSHPPHSMALLPKSVSGFLKMLHLLMSNDKFIFRFFVCWGEKFRECDPCDLSTKKRVFDGIYHLSSDCSDYLVGGWTNPTHLQEKIVKLDAFPVGDLGKKIQKIMQTKTGNVVMMWLLLTLPLVWFGIKKTHTSSPSKKAHSQHPSHILDLPPQLWWKVDVDLWGAPIFVVCWI